jgi:hypothetical protein
VLARLLGLPIRRAESESASLGIVLPSFLTKTIEGIIQRKTRNVSNSVRIQQMSDKISASHVLIVSQTTFLLARFNGPGYPLSLSVGLGKSFK